MNTTPHTSHFLTDSHAHAWLKSCVSRARIACHDSSSCAHVFVLTLPDYSTSPSLLTIFSLIILSFLLSINFLPRCGGQIPCAHSQMRTLAPLPNTTLSQVMSPTTTTSRRLLNHTSRNPRSQGALFTTVHPGARR